MLFVCFCFLEMFFFSSFWVSNQEKVFKRREKKKEKGKKEKGKKKERFSFSFFHDRHLLVFVLFCGVVPHCWSLLRGRGLCNRGRCDCRLFRVPFLSRGFSSASSALFRLRCQLPRGDGAAHRALSWLGGSGGAGGARIEGPLPGGNGGGL